MTIKIIQHYVDGEGVTQRGAPKTFLFTGEEIQHKAVYFNDHNHFLELYKEYRGDYVIGVPIDAWKDKAIMEDGLFIDGAFADNMPVNIARQLGFKKVLSVDVSPLRQVSRSNLKNSFDVMFRAMSCAIRNAHRDVKATVAIEAYKGAYNLDFDHVKTLIEVGEQAVQNNELLIRRKFSSFRS